jgi:Lrp/AsnC family leucine-responsive transcriptional regulator
MLTLRKGGHRDLERYYGLMEVDFVSEELIGKLAIHRALSRGDQELLIAYDDETGLEGAYALVCCRGLYGYVLLKYLGVFPWYRGKGLGVELMRLIHKRYAEKQGIIAGYHANVEPLSLGFHITAFINLSLDPKQKPEFYPFISACPNVLECDCVTGAFSMHIKVCFPSTQELDTFIGHLQAFGKTETQIVFSTPVPYRGINVSSLFGENADTEETPSSDTE